MQTPYNFNYLFDLLNQAIEQKKILNEEILHFNDLNDQYYKLCCKFTTAFSKNDDPILTVNNKKIMELSLNEYKSGIQLISTYHKFLQTVDKYLNPIFFSLKNQNIDSYNKEELKENINICSMWVSELMKYIHDIQTNYIPNYIKHISYMEEKLKTAIQNVANII